MTVSTSTNSVVYRGNSSATTFAVPFKVLDEDHFRVTRRVYATGVLDHTYIGTDYSYSGIGDDSGTLTLDGAALTSTYELVIERIVPYTQDLDIVNAGGFYPETVEEQLDLTVMGVQQLADLANRSIVVPIGEDGLELSIAAERAGLFLGFDSEGDLALLEGEAGPTGLPGTAESNTGITTIVNDVSNAVRIFDLSGNLNGTSAGVVEFNESIALAVAQNAGQPTYPDNIVWSLGFNEGANGSPVDATKASPSIRMERSYYDGTRMVSEWHWQMVSSAGVNVRPLTAVVAHDGSYSSIAGVVDNVNWTQRGGARQAQLNLADGNFNLAGGIALRYGVNNMTIATQLNAAGTVFLSLPYINGGDRLAIEQPITMTLANVPDFADDLTASGGGVPVGGIYRNGSILMIRAA